MAEKCTPAEPFSLAPQLLAKYTGAVWVAWPDGQSFGAALSQDDGDRYERGYRNRWRYVITGPAAIGLKPGCRLRTVRAQALLGGVISVSIDNARLQFLPGDPVQQDRVSRSAPACEINDQLVHVDEAGGRWTITIEEPNWLPMTKRGC
jgi:hypothetical protein